MAGVAGQWKLDVSVDGRTLPLNTSNITSLAIINNIHQFLPVLQMGFKDGPNILGGDYNIAGDGSKIKISIGNPAHYVYEDRSFQLSGSPDVVPASSYTNVGLKGFLDNTVYKSKVVDKFYEGTSSKVIGEIAKAVGFDYDGDDTDDAMDWLPNNTVLAQFVNHVANRGWASAKSCMMLACSDSGLLRYKDVEKLTKASPTKTFASNSTDGQPILIWGATTKSHVANAANGYGSTSIGMKPDGLVTELNKITSSLLSGKLSVNSLVQGLIGDLGTRIEQLAPLGGNTHDKWYEGRHQNRRGRSLFAYDVEIMSHIPLQVDLLDLVKLIPRDPNTGKVAEALVGNYVVTANTKFMSGNGFYEKAVLTSQGMS